MNKFLNVKLLILFKLAVTTGSVIAFEKKLIIYEQAHRWQNR